MSRWITREVTPEHVSEHEGRYGVVSSVRPHGAGETVTIVDFEAFDSKQ